ncbi:RNA polymerase III RPC4-domain-containing protein [Xylaria bambusicola]|uniref:RNA polymerase III RPC4-domain-containing protein n=1 Tax=Xylaria bambusicola TaxID=326684 RepID=UPI0020078CCC|nr:RNA polymerase III RPC4-domain-containing protein [Xylaria bambusicola]KAI0525675.1 RNA polymerase III RPC4-domain-containing protein [Xylaria bambusicola]
MPPGSRGGEKAGRGTRGGGGRALGASHRTAPRPSSDDPVPSSETSSHINDNALDHRSKTEAPLGSGRSTPTGLRTSQTPATSSRGTSRFKPKNVRRDEAERKRLEEDRSRDLASKIKAEERELRAEERRARRGRGRGGMSRGLIRRTVTASGPFSAIASESVKTDASRGGWATSSGFGKGDAFTRDSENRIRYQPRREHESRVNIDLLNGLTDGHAADGSLLYQPNRYTQKSAGNLPIGIHRTLHQNPEVKVKTQAELEAEDRQESDEEGNLFVDAPVGDPRDIGMNNDNEVWHAAPKNQVHVKTEPITEEDGVDVDMADIPEAPKAPPSPEVKKKPILDEQGLATDVNTEKVRRKEKKIAEDPEFMYSTMDVEALLRSLSLTTPAESEEGQGKDDQLFIFQLPPILPPLTKPSKSLDGQPETIDIVSTDIGSKIKLEDGVAATPGRSAGLPAEGGFIGRLNVRKSGKVELDWGGTTLNLGMETETDFLTTATIIEQKENVETAEETAGFAYGMGQVFGKFVLAPPCEDEDEWDPNIEDIMRAADNQSTI